MKNLLDLPAELVRSILHTLDPESFYMCLQSSKLFREHACASTSLIYDQIARVPGRWAFPVDCTGDRALLVKEFCRRAAKHLKAGSPWMSDVHVWRSSPTVDRKNSFIGNLWCNDRARRDSDGKWHNFAFVEVRPHDTSVLVYFMEDLSTDGRNWCPQLKHIISASSLSEHFQTKEGELLEYEIIKVAPFVPDKATSYDTHRSHIAVLYRTRLADCTCNNVWMKLLVFSLDSTFGPIVIETYNLQGNENDHVIAMAMSGHCQPVIVYSNYGCSIEYHSYKVVAYTIEQDQVTLERRIEEEMSSIIEPMQTQYGGLVSLSVHRNTVNLYPSTYPMPVWSTLLSGVNGLSNSTGGNPILRHDTHLPDIVEIFSKQSIGKAIASHHHHLVTEDDLNDGEPTCVNTALELMISREHSDTFRYREGAYILKAIQYPQQCAAFDLDADYHSLHHVYIAQLSQLPDLTNLSSIGLILAISHHAQRIAIASWKSVKVWSLEPKAFLDPDYSLSGAEGVPGDYAFTEGCGWQYYGSAKTERECVVLEPVELPSCGVVFGLEFRGEDELWGWSDEGLVRWRFGVHGQGKRGWEMLPT